MTEIEEYENLITMLADEHYANERYLGDLQDNTESEISKVEREMDGIEEDMAIYVAEIKKLKAMK